MRIYRERTADSTPRPPDDAANHSILDSRKDVNGGLIINRKQKIN